MEISFKGMSVGESRDVSFSEDFTVPESYGLVTPAVKTHFTGRLTKRAGDEGCALEGALDAAFSLSCDRCLQPFAYSVSVAVGETFEADSENSVYVNQHLETIDLSPVVFMNLLLNIPIKALCANHCKGLCPHCGSNLNEGDCGCVTKETDPRFEALRSLFQDKEV